MLSDFDRNHIREILGDTNDREYTWFTACLMRVIAKADPCTRRRFQMSFPEEVALVEGALPSPNGVLDRELDYLFGKADAKHLDLLQRALPTEYDMAVAGQLGRR